MAEISIEEYQAKKWIREVETELELVDRTLKNVTNACSSVVTEEDDIMKGIEQAGTKMREVWEPMCKEFKRAAEQIDGVIQKVAQTAKELLDNVRNIKKQI